MKNIVSRWLIVIVVSLGLPVSYGQFQHNVINIDTPLERITLENLDRIEELAIIGFGDVTDMAFSPSGNALLVASDSGTYVYAANSLETAPLRLEQYSTTRVVFNSTGSLLAVGNSLLPVVTVRNVEGWTLKHTFATSVGNHHMAFSPGNRYLAVGTGRDDLYLWEIETGDQIGYLDFVGSAFRNVAFHPNNDDVITTGLNFDNMRIWSFDELVQLYSDPIESEYLIIPPPGLQRTIEETIYDFVIDRDLNLLIGVTQDGIQFRELDRYDLIKTLLIPTQLSDSIEMSCDQQTLLFNHCGELHLWNINDVLELDNPVARTSTINCGSTIAISPDGNSIAVSDSQTLEVRRFGRDDSALVDLFQLCPVVPIDALDVEIVASELIVTGCDAPMSWQLQVSGSELINAHFHGSSMRDVIVDEVEYPVRVRNIEGRVVYIKPPEHLRTWVDSPILSQDSSWLVFGYPHSGLHFWDVKTGELAHSVMTSDTRHIFLSEGEQLLVTFGNEIGFYPTIRLWGIPSD